ncbi:MAG: bifunctional 5,10-methylenetetrahydrofolate dehydrogenase/5,10-methenyltetrahydrofolate cyclohydrolase [Candidatus Omnitrophica bacterium]|nr:bifunctional 5,10-methylenetetrahydrofolate dehydrogenase/5,10-methenyltetrahydrofolate cyclohydrolase [Candidatus Omnitrophota bacterium]
MNAQILDGKKVASQFKEQLKNEIEILKKRSGIHPVAVSVLSTDDPGAVSYAASQKKTADELGIDYRIQHVPPSISSTEFEKLIQQFNHNSTIHAVLINKPVPSQIDFSSMVNLLSEKKEMEGINCLNMGKIFLGQFQLVPCTAASVMEHLRHAQVPLKGKNVVIIGRSEIVGKPLIFLLLAQNATVTVCHSATDAAGQLENHLRLADIVIVAIGKPNFLKGGWLKPGAVVIDVGVNRVDGKITGDADFNSVVAVASAITPVPGGVGPVTAVMLMKNIVEAYKQQVSM